MLLYIMCIIGAEPGRVAACTRKTGDDGRRKCTVAQTFGVSRKDVYRHLEPSGGRRQPGRATAVSPTACL